MSEANLASLLSAFKLDADFLYTHREVTLRRSPSDKEYFAFPLFEGLLRSVTSRLSRLCGKHLKNSLHSLTTF
jgi:hypothetical protein